jgi:hypothetical protein
MADAGQRSMYKKPKNSFTKSSFVTLLLVSQRLTYDTKVEKFCLFFLCCCSL